MVKKRSDTCIFCHRRRCHFHIYTQDWVYDEVACEEHTLDLEKHADKVLGKKALRIHVTSTRKLKRGEK
jgi:hypothetical protein